MDYAGCYCAARGGGGCRECERDLSVGKVVEEKERNEFSVKCGERGVKGEIRKKVRKQKKTKKKKTT